MSHAEECSVITGLLIDLKLRELGREHNPVTMDRLHEASSAVGKIQQCRKQALFRDPR